MKRVLCFIMFLIILLASLPALAAAGGTSGLYTYEIKGNGTITITGFDCKANDGDIFVPTMIDGYNVTAIGDEAFKCEHLRRSLKQLATVSLTLPEGIKSVGKKAFWNATLSSINLPDGLQNIGAGAFVGNPTIQYKLSGSHPYIAVIDGALYSKSNKELLAYTHFDEGYKQYANYKYTIPEGILSIADYAFYRDVEGEKAATYKSNYTFNIEEVVFASTITKIGDFAFSGFRFDNETVLPERLKTIGESAFENAVGYCREDIVIPDGVTTIGKAAFRNSNLFYDYGEEITKIIISENSSLTEIDEDTFRGCKDSIAVNSIRIRRVG
ncbi:MAG: leucine-rich repeat protein [Eubacteriales bacterium]|nr:leucine-rich repeat protein [Eubacteriales bacterium]MDD3882111.1 leucine-rich repeat protein [Eubacteriales bacterium]MDD4513216.1 leucine-rich repeat protein [Eubacteriales bacterium]